MRHYSVPDLIGRVISVAFMVGMSAVAVGIAAVLVWQVAVGALPLDANLIVAGSLSALTIPAVSWALVVLHRRDKAERVAFEAAVQAYLAEQNEAKDN